MLKLGHAQVGHSEEALGSRKHRAAAFGCSIRALIASTYALLRLLRMPCMASPGTFSVMTRRSKGATRLRRAQRSHLFIPSCPTLSRLLA